ncbi:MAG: DUF2188 domain-containing protein [Metamycoplasmataceae bacterium]
MGFWNWKNKDKQNKKENETMKEDHEFSAKKLELETKVPLSKEPKKQKTSSLSESKKNTKQIGRNIYYVSARKDKSGAKVGWEVKKENATKVTRIVSTKEHALDIVKELAGNNESTVIIRKLDGSIQETIKYKSK